MQGLHVDESYRTALGTAFYDRVGELERLRRMAASRALTVVYGPRGVGKSELARYLVRRGLHGGGGAVVVDARRARARGLGGAAGAVVGGPERLARAALRALAEALASRAGLVGLVAGLVSALGEALAGLGAVLLFIDEFHELPGYGRGDYGEALGDLRSLAGLLAKAPGRLRVVVTVSEGFAATREAAAALEGYSAGWLLVEHLDRAHFQALHAEYASRNACNPSAGEVYALIGGTPGGLPDLCPLTREEIVEERVRAWASVVEEALAAARRRLEAEGVGVGPGDLVSLALRALREPVKPLREPRLFLIAETLVRFNVAYPKLGRGGLRYHPQYPVYRALLEEAAEGGAESLLDVDPWRVYERALRGG